MRYGGGASYGAGRSLGGYGEPAFVDAAVRVFQAWAEVPLPASVRSPQAFVEIPNVPGSIRVAQVWFENALASEAIRVPQVWAEFPSLASRVRVPQVWAEIVQPGSVRVPLVFVRVPNIDASTRVPQVWLETVDPVLPSIRVPQLFLRIPSSSGSIRVPQLWAEFASFDLPVRVYALRMSIPSPPSGSGGPFPDEPGTPGGVDPETGAGIVIPFVRMIPLLETRAYEVPRGSVSMSHYGSHQLRPSVSAGRAWEEIYAVRRKTDPNLRAFLVFLEDLLHGERVVLVDHFDLAAGLSTVSGTPTVAGAGQTGYLINTTGWGGTFVAGELLQLPGVPFVVQVAKTTNSQVSTTIPITPAVRAGAEPTDGGEILWGSAVRIAAFVYDYEAPRAGVDDLFVRLRIVFREAVGPLNLPTAPSA